MEAATPGQAAPGAVIVTAHRPPSKTNAVNWPVRLAARQVVVLGVVRLNPFIALRAVCKAHADADPPQSRSGTA